MVGSPPSPRTNGAVAALSGALANAAASGEGTLSLRVVVRTPTVETFVQKYSRFVKEDRIFIFTKSSQPPGTKLRFTLELVDGKPLLSGEGSVTRVRSEASDPTRPPGMELRFVATDDASRKIVGLLLAERDNLVQPKSPPRDIPAVIAPSLPVLPHTAAQIAYDPPAPDAPTIAKSEADAPTQAVPGPGSPAMPPLGASHAARGATPPGQESPLLRGAIVGQRTDLPRRPGAGRATLIGVAPPVIAPSPKPVMAAGQASPQRTSVGHAALAPPAHAEAPGERAPVEAGAATTVMAATSEAGATASTPFAAPAPTPLIAAVVPAGPSAMPAPLRPPAVAPAPVVSPVAAVAPTSALVEALRSPLPGPLADAPRKLSPPPSQRFMAIAQTLALEPEAARAELAAATARAAPAEVDGLPLVEGEPDTDQPSSRTAIGPPPRSGEAARPSALDADSLFASGEAHPFADASESTQVEPLAGMTLEDTSGSFPGLGVAPAFAESWRESADASLVPANPFSEVSDNAIEYFVEWSLDRSTATGPTSQGATEFDAVEMKPPARQEATAGLAPMAIATPAEPPRRRGVVGLLIGIGIGIVTGGVAVTIARRQAAPAPTVASAPRPTVTADRDPPLDPKRPEKSPSLNARPAVAAAPAPPVAPSPSPAAAPAPTATPTPAGGKLSIVSKPSGGTATLDGRRVGQTPVTVDVTPGHHQVGITLERYMPFTQSIEQPGEIEATLKRPRATLKISSTPIGADVTVAGERHGKTPTSVGLPAYESYDVEVALGPGRTWKKRVYVKGLSLAVHANIPATKPGAVAKAAPAAGKAAPASGKPGAAGGKTGAAGGKTGAASGKTGTASSPLPSPLLRPAGR